ncbi:hypothetical protein O6H91_12G077500 [Diphasiastrum complanatum]|uniref:Uncharacterized protein n=1 Tax=Diphasiastrum complanatum TaxID=34168 RepID=A0ACC2C3P6_DIPCM|nr:hypothetical protein O6H91_12G077500 [Diphasiastrum complanatum]
MAAARDGFGILYEKLQIDHPVVQRHAVIAIFERFKASCTGRLQSGLAQGAIAHCFSSLHPAVIDQTVKEVCKLVKEQILSMERGLQELQAALDSVAGDRVGVIITGIGFLCRIAVDEAVAGKDMQKWAMILQANPLVKALVSREEAHFEILQQLSIIILHAHSATPRLQIAMEFLRSFFNLILIRPLLSCGQVLFARQLHSHLSLLACAYPTVGLQLLKMLIEYTEYYPIQSVQEIDMKAAAVRDLVDILESLLKNPQAQRQEAVQYGYSLLFCLLGLCHELKAHALPSLPALLLFKRAQKLLQSYKTGMPESCDVLLVSLAHILAATQVEQEQLLIIDLIISWFTGCNSKDSFLNTGSAQNFPSVLAFVYPALQLISLPSPQLKSAAIGLLQIIEDFTPICTPRVSLHCEKAFFASLAVQKELQMAGVVHYLLCSLWSQEKLGTWLTVDNFLLGKLPETPDNMNCTWCWLRNLRLQLSAGRESASNLIWDFKAEKNKGFVLWTSIIAATLLCHPSPEVSIGAADIVAAICTAKPIMGLSLFPVILFSFKNKIKGRSSKNGAILLALLNILPTLANHATTLPLIVQVLEPMLQYKQDLMMQATGIRLLCKTWECSDRAFPSLEKALQPSKFLDKTLDLHLAVSIAVSLRDVCKNNSDRGTDLVLSIQACIESKISVVQALGLESLSYLCEDDTIDFYTTWLVISKLFQNLPTNPLMAKSLCMLLGHGSLDAVQHLEESQSILSILWQLATYKTEGDQRFDWKVRAAALKAIQEYEVEVMENVFPLHGKHVELLLSESSPEVQTVFKDIVIKYLIHEHRNRDRGQKERKHNLNRLEKLLEALPQVIFPTLKSSSFPGTDKAVAEFPGAALLLLDIPSHNLAVKTTLGYRNKAVKSRKDAYERMFSEIADQLNIKQNLITILLALESWYSFLPRWLKAEIASLEQQVLSDDPENFVIKAADNIMKILYKTIEEGIPRVAVNATLALAALCKALPSSAHSICKSMAEYLRSQLSVDEHEYIRWSSAISLGVVSTSLHATDQMLRSEIVKLLLGCAAKSESGIVRAGCAIALGSICQNLLKDSSITDISDVSDKSKDQEISLLMNIVKNLAQLLVEICPSCEQTLNSILNFKISKDEELCIEGQRKVITSRVEQEIEENVWAVVGLLIGLGLSVTAIARAGKISLVLAITDAVIAWIPQKAEANLSVHSGSSYNYICSFSSLSLAVGACIALPMCVHVCYSLELMRDAEVDSLLGRLHLLLQDTWNLQSHSEIGIWMMQLSAAASIGTGNLFAFLLFEGSHPMQLEVVNSIMQTLLKGSKMSQATYGQLGSMVGLANALGAGAVLSPPLRNWSLEDKVGIFSEVETTDGLFVSNPLCLYGHCEGFLRSVVQDIIGLARGGQDLQVKSHAGWALGLFYKAFLRTHRFEQETGTGDGSAFLLKPQDLKVSTIQGYNMKSLESLPSGSTLSLLCSWLVKACSEEGNISRPKAILSVLRCLEKAPRLPAVDWGGLIRRLMRHDQYLVDSSATVLTLDMSNRLGEQQSIRIQVRQQCVSFSLAHAVQISSLALVLDELYDLSRLSTIELPLLLYLFEHVMLIERIFSEYRLKKLWEDLSSFLGSTQFQQLNNQLNAESKEKLRISMWKGLNKLVKNSQPHSGGLKLKRDFDFQNLKQLMKILIDYLPSSHLYGARGSSKKQELPHEEWKVAVDCLSQTPSEWLLQVFQAKDSYQTSKAILARARLVLKGCLHSNTLKTACTWLTSQRPSEIWTLLVEVTMALKQLTMEEKQEWIVNIMDTAMTCNYPLSAMQLLACFSSCWSSAAPLLVIDARIMETLPLCLPVFFLESSWQKNINVVFDKIISLTEIFAQRMSSRTSIPENIDTQVMDENKLTLKGLYLVAKRTSLALKEHLPHDMHTKVAHLNTI